LPSNQSQPRCEIHLDVSEDYVVILQVKHADTNVSPRAALSTTARKPNAPFHNVLQTQSTASCFMFYPPSL